MNAHDPLTCPCCAEAMRLRRLLERAKDWWGDDDAGRNVRNDILAEFGIATEPVWPEVGA